MYTKLTKISQYGLIIILAAIIICKANEIKKEVLSEELFIEEFAENSFLVTHCFPWPGNSLIVKLDSLHFLWMDTPYTPEATVQVLDWLYAKFGKQVKLVEINTGFHIDNLGGNQELKKRNIPIYGSDLTCKLLKLQSKATMSKMDSWLKDPKNKKYREAYRDFVFVEPTVIFDINEKQIIELGSEKLEVFFPGPTHTYDNLVVYIPSKKILFGGCMILSADAKKLGFIDDGNVDEWAKSIQKIEEQYKDIETIVPGHGDVGSISLLEHTINIVNEFKGK